MDDAVSKDLFNDFPDELLRHILSFLTTKEAALTSVLSKRWRYLFAFLSNLDFDDSIYLHAEKRIQNPVVVLGLDPWLQIYINNKRMKLSTSFQDFVNRVLKLQGTSPLDKFSLKLIDEYDPVDPDCVIPWINNVLSRGVSDLSLIFHSNEKFSLPSSIFLSTTLVRLRINVERKTTFDVKKVHLPLLKSLCLKRILFQSEEHDGFRKLISGCSVLEELVTDYIFSYRWASFSVSVPTLKRLIFHGNVLVGNPNSVSFNTPNLVYLEYSEVYAIKYPILNFDSLVEAKIDLLLAIEQIIEVRYSSASELEINMVGSATDFMMAISNVGILHLSENTLEVLTFCCKSIPIFNNLTHLTIKSDSKVGWESLPELLNNCPNLSNLVFLGLLHKGTDGCGLCKSRKEDVSSCLSSSPVKVLKILINNNYIERQIEQVKHFLETMPHLEQVVIYYDLCLDEEVKVSIQQQMHIKVASPKCKVKLISRDFSVSSTKWGPLL